MPKKADELGALAVGRLKAPGLHAVGGVAGLQLQVSPTGAASWVLRLSVAGKRRDMGLGGYPDVTLASARDAARRARERVRDGADPIEEARASRSVMQASRAAARTFEHCAKAYIKAQTPGWKNVKHAAQWTATLTTYAYPMIGQLLVRDVSLAHVLAVLEPLWTTKTETATRLRSRMELVLDWAAARGYRDGLNPARWKGNLASILPAPGKVTKVEHHAALPVDDVGAFMARLRAAAGTGARALEFAILTAARSGEVRGATWAEVDLAAAVWTVPADRMKSGREHRVPLSDAAIELLRALPRMDDADLVFPAPRGAPLSDMTLSAVLRRMDVPAVPHGFRSSFRDWAGERTSYPNEVCEMALAHAINNKAEAAYRRGDLFDKRRRLMAEWAAFCSAAQAPAEVHPIRRGGKGRVAPS